MRRISRVTVDGMLGRFDHLVPFDPSWEFIIIHGPNGVGKTKLLELIAAIFNFQLGRLKRLSFKTATIQFDDGHELTAVRVENGRRQSSEGAGSMLIEAPRSRDYSQSVELQFTLARNGEQIIAWNSSSRNNRLAGHYTSFAESMAPVMQIGRDEFHDRDIGDVLTLQEVFERYRELFPSELLPAEEGPPRLKNFLNETSVYLIETQRLLSLPPAGQSSRNSRRMTREVPHQELPRPTVAQYAEDLGRRLREAQAQNSRISQELDRTFPGRILGDTGGEVASDERIRSKYNEQVEMRQQLQEIDLVDATSEHLPLPDRELKPWERTVLWTYLEDTEQKLATFRDLSDRVQLLCDIVDSRFEYKKIRVSRDNGFDFVTTDDTRRSITPRHLSSGEQHELVLAYDLLFQVKPNSLVLIDEPEISLHVGWQREFLQDLLKISQLTSLRFIIATHSPQIIHRWWDRAISLVSATVEAES